MEYPSRTKGPLGGSVKTRSALLGLASVAFALGLSACSSSSSPTTSTSGPASTSATTTTIAPTTSTTLCTVPQGNGGDHDADNNGGPNDGDGCQ